MKKLLGKVSKYVQMETVNERLSLLFIFKRKNLINKVSNSPLISRFLPKRAITTITSKHVLNLVLKQLLLFLAHSVVLCIHPDSYHRSLLSGHRSDRGSVVDSCTDTNLRRKKPYIGYISLL